MVNQQRKEHTVTQQTNQPASKVRYGGLKATIWRNPSKDGGLPRYSAVYTRTYRDQNGEFQDTHSLSEIDSLKLLILVPKVADRIAELKDIDRGGQPSEDDSEGAGQ